MELSLSPEVMVGLKRLGNPALINDDIFSKLLETGVNVLLRPPLEQNYESNLTAAKGDVVKEAYAAFLMLMIEAARHNSAPDQINKVFNNLNWPASRASSLTNLYVSKLQMVRAALACIGDHPPHITDVHWQLNYCVKSSVNEHTNNPLVLVQFETEGEKSEQHVQFSCTLSELQDLQAKLKEALRHVDHIGQLGN